MTEAPHPAGAGLVVTMVLILAGMAIYGYLASSIVELIAHGVLTGTVSERRRLRMIDEISDHFIVCGFGRVGRQVTDEFRAAGVPFVILDFNREVLELAREENVPYIDGSGTKDEDLEAAGLARARGLSVQRLAAERLFVEAIHAGCPRSAPARP